MKNFYVIEGEHTNPNEIETILKNTEKKHGPFEEQEATQKDHVFFQYSLVMFQSH